MRFILALVMAIIVYSMPVSARDYGAKPDVAILTFDMQGGQIPGQADGPMLRILADGTLIARAARQGDPAINAQLDSGVQATLFDTLIDANVALTLAAEVIRSLPPKQTDLSPQQLPLLSRPSPEEAIELF